MTEDAIVTEEELAWLERLERLASPGPWRAMIEGRDHTSGDSFIMIGPVDDREEDMYVNRETGTASAADLEFISGSRTHLPRLLAEIRRHRSRPSE